MRKHGPSSASPRSRARGLPRSRSPDMGSPTVTGDLQHLHQCFHVANTKDVAQPQGWPWSGAGLAPLTCGSNGRRGSSPPASPSSCCSPARSTPGEQWDELRTGTLSLWPENGHTHLTARGLRTDMLGSWAALTSWRSTRSKLSWRSMSPMSRTRSCRRLLRYRMALQERGRMSQPGGTA